MPRSVNWQKLFNLHLIASLLLLTFLILSFYFTYFCHKVLSILSNYIIQQGIGN